MGAIGFYDFYAIIKAKDFAENIWDCLYMGGGTMDKGFAYNEYVEKYIDALKKIYGKAMKVVLLYGSYARGDYNEKSDVDIMILVDMPDSVINQFFAQTADMTYDFNMDNHVEFSPAVKNTKQFYKWVEVNPFYKNVKKEGRVLYEAAWW